MAAKKIIALEGDERRAALLRRVLLGLGTYEVVVSPSAMALLELMDGSGDVALVITNTRVTKDERDGIRFIKTLHVKYQTFQTPLPPIIVCSGEQSDQIVRQYALRFSDPSLIFYVLIRDGELESAPSPLVEVIERCLTRRAEVEARVPDDPGGQIKGKLRALLRSTVALPQVPEVATRVQGALRDPEVTFVKLAQIISTDLNLGANIVKMANSPIYGVSGKISTLEAACKQIGLNSIANVVVATKVMEALEAAPASYDIKRLRRHSFAAAATARLVGRRCHTLGDAKARMEFSGTMFAAGLLHDIGKVLISLFFPDDSQQIDSAIAAKACSTAQAEAEVVGVSHADTGLLAAIEWSFPVILINVIGGHHMALEDILSRLKTRAGRLAQRVIRIADAASYELGFGMALYDQAAPPLDAALFAETGVSHEEFARWAPELKADIGYTFQALGEG